MGIVNTQIMRKMYAIVSTALLFDTKQMDGYTLRNKLRVFVELNTKVDVRMNIEGNSNFSLGKSIRRISHILTRFSFLLLKNSNDPYIAKACADSKHTSKYVALSVTLHKTLSKMRNDSFHKMPNSKIPRAK